MPFAKITTVQHSRSVCSRHQSESEMGIGWNFFLPEPKRRGSPQGQLENPQTLGRRSSSPPWREVSGNFTVLYQNPDPTGRIQQNARYREDRAECSKSSLRVHTPPLKFVPQYPLLPARSRAHARVCDGRNVGISLCLHSPLKTERAKYANRFRTEKNLLIPILLVN